MNFVEDNKCFVCGKKFLDDPGANWAVVPYSNTEDLTCSRECLERGLDLLEVKEVMES
jgi:hypothetical protein